MTSLTLINVEFLVKKVIFSLYGYDVKSDDDLYLPPYNLKAYDIVYILVNAFIELGYLRKTFSKTIIENRKFNTVFDISSFLLSI